MLSQPSPPRSPGPADRARIALLDHHGEPDWIVAKLADATPAIVQRARQELQAAGHIPAQDPGLSPDAYSSRPPAGQRAERELMRDPARSNLILADMADCHVTTILKVRRQLEALGAIPVLGAWDRRRRTEPRARQDHDAQRAELPPPAAQHGPRPVRDRWP